jgi:hypothetical protein
MSTEVKVGTIPDCDLCATHGVTVPAYADAKLAPMGPWANVCRQHFDQHGCTLGTGYGQRLVKSC